MIEVAMIIWHVTTAVEVSEKLYTTVVKISDWPHSFTMVVQILKTVY